MKLFDKMYKYEMDPTRTVGATEQTQDAGRTETNIITPQQLRWAEVYIENIIDKIVGNFLVKN